MLLPTSSLLNTHSTGTLPLSPACRKPSAQVKIGDEVEILYASGVLKFRVLNIKETVKKDEASSLYEVIV